MTPKPSQTIVCWFSCGAASAVATKLAIERWSKECIVRVCNNPVAEEHPDNLRFLKDCEAWFGLPVESVTHPDWPTCSAKDVWEKRRYMSGVAGAPCTTLLKREARAIWEKSNPTDFNVFGITADPRDRLRAKLAKADQPTNLFPLVENGITKAHCLQALKDAGIKPPAMYALGFPNANCIGCVKASSPDYWKLVRRTYPDVFQERCQKSREIGCKLVEIKHHVRIFLDELPPDEPNPQAAFDMPECGVLCELFNNKGA